LEYYNYEVIPDPLGPEYEGGWRRLGRDMLETVILALILFLVINTITARIRVESVSMQPNLYEGDFVLVNRVAYNLGQPERGDIVVFRFPPNPEETPYIKRVIGLPGDTLRVHDGLVFINDVVLVEPYIKVPTGQNGTWSIPENAIFVMGDNRSSSSDSRTWGLVPYENIIGKALFIYLPFSHWAWLDHGAATAAVP
jgi:signal peptidase I